MLLTYLSFFPSNYTINKKKIESLSKNDLRSIYKIYNIEFNPFNFQEFGTNTCYLYIIKNQQILKNWANSCRLIFPVHNQLSFSDYLDFLSLHYLFLKNNNYSVITVSEGKYNSLGIYLALYNQDLEKIILIGELDYDLPLIWQIIEPKICYIFNSKENCVEYEIIKYLQRKEVYERILSPVIWIVNKKDLKIKYKKSFEIFHLLGIRSKNTITKDIILKE